MSNRKIWNFSILEGQYVLDERLFEVSFEYVLALNYDNDSKFYFNTTNL